MDNPDQEVGLKIPVPRKGSLEKPLLRGDYPVLTLGPRQAKVQTSGHCEGSVPEPVTTVPGEKEKDYT